MLKTLTSTHVMPVGGVAFYIHGLNSDKVLSVGTGGYKLTGSLVRDPMRVEAFSSWVLDNNERLLQGAGVQLGMLTGEANSALLILKGGIQGADGNPKVVLQNFQSEWGLVTHIYSLPNVTPAVYYVRTVVMYD